MGNPYATTHVTRPFDAGKYPPDEHPFEGLARMIYGVGEIKKTVKDMIIYGSAPTYLREYADLYCAGAVERGMADGFLFGRMAFADPDFANEIVKNGRIDFSSTTLCKYSNNWYAVTNGKVAWGYSGKLEYNGRKYNIKNGIVRF